MESQKTIQEVALQVLTELHKLNYSKRTVKQYRECYNGLLRYAEGILYYSEKTGLNYLAHKHGLKLEGFFGKHPLNVSADMRCLQVLWDYAAYGTMVIQRRPAHPRFECPEPFRKEYEAFQAISRARAYRPSGISSRGHILHRFLQFIHDQGITVSDQIRPSHVTRFLEFFSACRTNYIANVISTLRNYLTFLYSEGFMSTNVSLHLPKVRVIRQAFIPASWNPDDVVKLLAAIDRANPRGKRDYAILLIVVRLGLRVSDIRNLTLNNVDWQRKCLSIVMTKTQRPLELPLLDDVGWALIDYLQHGRPATTSDRVFIRHRAPYDGFSHTDNLQRMLHRYMHVAGLSISEQTCGLHSLRSTLARTLLEHGTPLPVIADVLGHQDIQTTSHYLKIDLTGLRHCVIDPDEVVADEC